MINEQEKTTRTKFNFLKKYYDETWDEAAHTLHVGLFKKETDSLSTAYKQATEHLLANIETIAPISKSSIVLDVGCGTGKTLIELCAKFGCSGVGVDLSDEQIKDAKIYVRELNAERMAKKLPKLLVKFVRASASELSQVFAKDEQFSHVISQDAIMLVADKQALYENVYRLLAPGGVFAVADFLAQAAQSELTTTEHDLVYKMVNWNEGFSFKVYQQILQATGLNVVKAEQRDQDMIWTYAKLAKKMKAHENKADGTYTELKNRYEGIVSAIENGKMGWGFFFAQKPVRKTALIAGTKTKSIGRFVAVALHKLGYEIYLYGRSAKTVDKAGWHERACDISNEKSISKLLNEVQSLDLVLMFADAEGGHGTIEELTKEGVESCFGAKLVGSVLLTKAIVQKFKNRQTPIQMIWGAGGVSDKPKDLIIYGLINNGLAAFVKELNRHYHNIVEAFYLPFTVISPSTLGDAYIKQVGPQLQKMAKHPSTIVDTIMGVIGKQVMQGGGMIVIESKVI